MNTSRPLRLFTILILILATTKAGEDSLFVWAQQGDTAAQAKMGVVYHLREGIPKDSIEPVKSYHLAAEQGVYLAHLTLELAYKFGTKVICCDISQPKTLATRTIFYSLKSNNESSSAAQRPA